MNNTAEEESVLIKIEPEMSNVSEEHLDTLHEFLLEKPTDVQKIRAFIADHEGILTASYNEYGRRNILQVTCSLLAKNISDDNVDLLDVLIGEDGSALFYSNKEDGHKEALHYAALSKSSKVLGKIVDSILKFDPKRLDATTCHGETALCLLMKKPPKMEHLESFNVLLDAGVDVDISDNDNFTPVLLACRKFDAYKARKFKKRGYVRNIKNIITALILKGCDIDVHVYQEKTARSYIEKYQEEMLTREILDGLPKESRFNKWEKMRLEVYGFLKQGKEEEFLNARGLNRFAIQDNGTVTLLQLACLKDLHKCVELLIKRKAPIDIKTPKNDYPVVIAGRRANVKTFAFLLKHLNSKQVPGQVVVDIAQNLDQKQTAAINHQKCLEILLKKVPRIVNYSDANGMTALHWAATKRRFDVVIFLLRKGALLSKKNSEGVMALELIDAETLEKHFDYCVYYKKPHVFTESNVCPNDEDDEKLIKINYKSILPETEHESQMEAIRCMSDTIHLKKLLQHALVASFIHLKWRRIHWFFYANVALMFLFCAFLYIHTALVLNDSGCNTPLLILSIILILKMVIHISTAPRKYTYNFENIFQVVLQVLTLLTLLPGILSDQLRKNLLAISILISANVLVLSLEHIPRVSTNVKMFKRVSFNFFKFILLYVILIMGFAGSFYILFRGGVSSASSPMEEQSGTDFFQTFALTTVKTFVMFTGEFEAASLTFRSSTSMVVFMIFVFVISIVVFNLLNGLAVSDIQKIRDKAEVIAIEARVEDMLCFEICMSKLQFVLNSQKFIPQKVYASLMRVVFEKLYTVPKLSQGRLSLTLEGYIANVSESENVLWRFLRRRLPQYELDTPTWKKIKNILDVRKQEEQLVKEKYILEELKGLRSEIVELRELIKLTYKNHESKEHEQLVRNIMLE